MRYRRTPKRPRGNEGAAVLLCAIGAALCLFAGTAEMALVFAAIALLIELAWGDL